MPKPPVKSGMKPMLPTNTIPAGKYGQYACADSSHGVEKGPDNVFRVLCLSNGSYQVPTEKHWPVCHTKTTTVSPAIEVAMSSILGRHRRKLEARYNIYMGVEKRRSFTNVPKHNWWMEVTLPTLIGLSFIIVVLLFCASPGSPLCGICSEDFDKKHKITIPLKKKDGH